MPHATSVLAWQDGVAASAIIVIASLLVTWLIPDRLHVRRAEYVAILASRSLHSVRGTSPGPAHC